MVLSLSLPRIFQDQGSGYPLLVFKVTLYWTAPVKILPKGQLESNLIGTPLIKLHHIFPQMQNIKDKTYLLCSCVFQAQGTPSPPSAVCCKYQYQYSQISVQILTFFLPFFSSQIYLYSNWSNTTYMCICEKNNKLNICHLEFVQLNYQKTITYNLLFRYTNFQVKRAIHINLHIHIHICESLFEYSYLYLPCFGKVRVKKGKL